MERSVFKAVIDLVDVSQLLDLPELLEHRVVKECVALFNCDGTYRIDSIQEESQRNKLIQKQCLQCVDLQEFYTALVDMGHALEDGNSVSRRSADTRWYPIQVVGLRPQGVIYHPCPPW